jgi:hypothetical protein
MHELGLAVGLALGLKSSNGWMYDVKGLVLVFRSVHVEYIQSRLSVIISVLAVIQTA